jgi:hypothetical protein
MSDYDPTDDELRVIARSHSEVDAQHLAALVLREREEHRAVLVYRERAWIAQWGPMNERAVKAEAEHLDERDRHVQTMKRAVRVEAERDQAEAALARVAALCEETLRTGMPADPEDDIADWGAKNLAGEVRAAIAGDRSPAAGAAPTRDDLGHLVRHVWVKWAEEQPNPKASWLVPWSDLAESDREVDRRIGEACYRLGRAAIAGDGPPAAGYGADMGTNGPAALCSLRCARCGRPGREHEGQLFNCPGPPTHLPLSEVLELAVDLARRTSAPPEATT